MTRRPPMRRREYPAASESSYGGRRLMSVTVWGGASPVTMLLALIAPSSWPGTCPGPSDRAGAVLPVRAQCGRCRAESGRAGFRIV